MTANTLEISFESRALRTLCEDEAVAESKLGTAGARALRSRLADLRSADSIRDLPAGNPRIDEKSEELLIDVSQGLALVFQANHVTNPQTPHKRVDWGHVSRIKLLRI